MKNICNLLIDSITTGTISSMVGSANISVQIFGKVRRKMKENKYFVILIFLQFKVPFTLICIEYLCGLCATVIRLQFYWRVVNMAYSVLYVNVLVNLGVYKAYIKL